MVDRFTGCGCERHLAGGDARHVEEILDESRQEPGVAGDDLGRMMAPLLGHEIRPQQLRPPGDRVERRAQFMRDRGEELVLQLIGAFGRLPRRSFTDEQVVALVLDGGAHAIGRIAGWRQYAR